MCANEYHQNVDSPNQYREDVVGSSSIDDPMIEMSIHERCVYVCVYVKNTRKHVATCNACVIVNTHSNVWKNRLEACFKAHCTECTK